jgi:integrase/recombinase XerD
MLQRPAKVLESADVRRLLRHVHDHAYPARDSVIILLSFKAGLRACEIAGLEWPMLLGPRLAIADRIHVSKSIAKMGSGRTIPIHSELKRRLRLLHRQEGRPTAGPVIQSQRGGSMTAKSLVNWFTQLYRELGMVGCSSHSGRRTFITQSARIIAKTGGSLRDIQELAGHRAITTTERYIMGSRPAQRRIIALL